MNNNSKVTLCIFLRAWINNSVHFEEQYTVYNNTILQFCRRLCNIDVYLSPYCLF